MYFDQILICKVHVSITKEQTKDNFGNHYDVMVNNWFIECFFRSIEVATSATFEQICNMVLVDRRFQICEIV